ncbi:MAG: hypothetical protein NTY19_43780 [Planctomycetota bacterium]|nr:hypothetical protein [Planctomycetota bacterium]
MDDPLDYVDITDVAVHGDPGKWRFQGCKQGSPTPATSANAPLGTMKHYDLYADEFGDEIELHYFRYTDGSVDDVKVRPRS